MTWHQGHTMTWAYKCSSLTYQQYWHNKWIDCFVKIPLATLSTKNGVNHSQFDKPAISQDIEHKLLPKILDCHKFSWCLI